MKILKKPQISRKPSAIGLSLVEVLIVVAVIGIISAIAVPSVGRVTDNANSSKAKRNAQDIASIGTAAQSVGYVFVGSSVNEAAQELVNGVTGKGSFSETVFRMPHLSQKEIDAALSHLELVGGALVYCSNP